MTVEKPKKKRDLIYIIFWNLIENPAKHYDISLKWLLTYELVLLSQMGSQEMGDKENVVRSWYGKYPRPMDCK